MKQTILPVAVRLDIHLPFDLLQKEPASAPTALRWHSSSVQPRNTHC